MPRDVFPYSDDREAITLFLEGRHTTATHTGHVQAGADGKLRFEGCVIAWFDTGGSVVVRLVEGWSEGYVRTAINELCKQLGMATEGAQREVREGEFMGIKPYPNGTLLSRRQAGSAW